MLAYSWRLAGLGEHPELHASLAARALERCEARCAAGGQGLGFRG